MDAHENEYGGAVAGMSEVYGVVPTPPICVSVGSRRIPVWNVGAVVTWTDPKGRHRHGNVVGVTYLPGDSRDADDRVYAIQTRDPVTLRREYIDLDHTALCEW
jgi:hypothetical protein